jgi:hypothetical protein
LETRVGMCRLDEVDAEVLILSSVRTWESRLGLVRTSRRSQLISGTILAFALVESQIFGSKDVEDMKTYA